MTRSSTAACLACGGFLCEPLGPRFDAPLSTAGWPATEAEAKAMRRHPVALTMCAGCGHVQNSLFDPHAVPTSAGLKMFNSGDRWSRFLEQQVGHLLDGLDPGEGVLEIGHGGGEFLSRLAAEGYRCVGIDPSGEGRPEFRTVRRHFEPADLVEHQPRLVLIRHVLEHLASPRRFLSELCMAAMDLPHTVTVYVEVPGVEVAVRERRISDFLYEHVSHFSEDSMRALWHPLPAEVESVSVALGGEIIWARVCIHPAPSDRRGAARSAYGDYAEAAVVSIRQRLRQWIDADASVVVWGGTGKAAAFMNRIGMVSGFRVVDSDERKVGGWVPGVGLPIEDTAVLHQGPPPVIVVPSRWRVADVAAEIQSMSIEHRGIFTEENGSLVEVSG